MAGDSLSVIAQKYDTSVEAIQTVNDLSSTVILVDQKLLIPPSDSIITPPSSTVEIAPDVTNTNSESDFQIQKPRIIEIDGVIPKYSRSKIQSWIRTGCILVNNQNVKTGYSLELNDQIQIRLPKIDESLKNIKPEEIKLDILYEDNDLVVINKPAGMVVHPGTGVSKGTLVNGLLHYFKDLSNIKTRFISLK